MEFTHERQVEVGLCAYGNGSFSCSSAGRRGLAASPRRLGGICAKGVMVQQAQQEREFRLVFYLNQVQSIHYRLRTKRTSLPQKVTGNQSRLTEQKSATLTEQERAPLENGRRAIGIGGVGKRLRRKVHSHPWQVKGIEKGSILPEMSKCWLIRGRGRW